MKPEEIVREYKRGETIVERGSRGRDLFVVRSGAVLIQWNPGEAPVVYGSGEIFGETAAVLGLAYPFQAEAEAETSVCVLEPSVLNRLITGNAEFAFRFIQQLAGRVSQGQERVPLNPTALDEPVLDVPEFETTAAMPSLARGILACRVSNEAPAPVKGRLLDLARESELPIIEAYESLQLLLDRRLVRLVDDQLSVLEAEELESLAAS